jgi:hypothetical protein
MPYIKGGEAVQFSSSHRQAYRIMPGAFLYKAQICTMDCLPIYEYEVISNHTEVLTEDALIHDV